MSSAALGRRRMEAFISMAWALAEWSLMWRRVSKSSRGVVAAMAAPAAVSMRTLAFSAVGAAQEDHGCMGA